MTIRVGVEWIDTFPKNSECRKNWGLTNLDYSDDNANAFYNHMKKKGHIGVFNWGNDNAWETDFRHPDSNREGATQKGDSLNWIDNVHFLYFGDHGNCNSTTKTIFFSRSHDFCDSSSDTWKLGVKMLKWMVLNCCRGVLNTDPTHIGTVWFPPAYGIHMIFGFIDLSYDTWWFRDIGKDFGDHAGGGNRLANAWLDAAGSDWGWNHPIAMAYGATKEEAIDRLANETIAELNHDVSSPNWIAYKWRDF
jgi:hypothetical protein